MELRQHKEIDKTDFSSLPVEVVVLIAKSCSRRKDVLNLARTCKDMYRILEKLLFRVVRFQLDENGNIDEGLKAKFLENGGQNDAIKMIESLKMRGCRFSFFPSLFEKPKIARTLESITTIIRSFTNGPAAIKRFQCEIINENALGSAGIEAFFDTQKNSLQEVDIRAEARVNDLPAWKPILTGIKRLNAIRMLYLRSPDIDESNNAILRDVFQILSLKPTMKDLGLFRFSGMKLVFPPLIRFQHTQLHSLTLESCRFLESFLVAIAPFCRLLKKCNIYVTELVDYRPTCAFIQYLHGLEELSLISTEPASAVDIKAFPYGHLLRNHKSTLRILALWSEKLWADGFEVTDSEYESPSFRDIVPISPRSKAKVIYIDALISNWVGEIDDNIIRSMCYKIDHPVPFQPALRMIIIMDHDVFLAAYTIEWVSPDSQAAYTPVPRRIEDPIAPNILKTGYPLDRRLNSMVRFAGPPIVELEQEDF
ncbi:hypothetical protein ABW19_dt0208969 [Dactylella cylindrospora]|nr:hypothetical protein ABW19_dt0208969 [Dactylella cylindrospora]